MYTHMYTHICMSICIYIYIYIHIYTHIYTIICIKNYNDNNDNHRPGVGDDLAGVASSLQVAK